MVHFSQTLILFNPVIVFQIKGLLRGIYLGNNYIGTDCFYLKSQQHEENVPLLFYSIQPYFYSVNKKGLVEISLICLRKVLLKCIKARFGYVYAYRGP